jgi:hypothetical protein
MTELSERPAAMPPDPDDDAVTGSKYLRMDQSDHEIQVLGQHIATRTAPVGQVFDYNPELFNPKDLPLTYLDDLSGLSNDEFAGLTLEQLAAAHCAVSVARTQIDGIEAEVDKIIASLPGILGVGVIWSEMTAAYLAEWA